MCIRGSAEMAEYAFSARASCFFRSSFAMVADMQEFAVSARVRKMFGILIVAEMAEFAFSARIRYPFGHSDVCMS